MYSLRTVKTSSVQCNKYAEIMRLTSQKATNSRANLLTVSRPPLSSVGITLNGVACSAPPQIVHINERTEPIPHKSPYTPLYYIQVMAQQEMHSVKESHPGKTSKIPNHAHENSPTRKDIPFVLRNEAATKPAQKRRSFGTQTHLPAKLSPSPKQ